MERAKKDTDAKSPYRGYNDPDPPEYVDLGNDISISVNSVRSALAKAPENLRQIVYKEGVDIYCAEEFDVRRLMGKKDLLPLLIGIDSEMDCAIEGVLKR